MDDDSDSRMCCVKIKYNYGCAAYLHFFVYMKDGRDVFLCFRRLRR